MLSTRGKTLEKYLEFSKKNIADMVQKVRGKLSKLARKTLSALSTIDVHARDVVNTMIEVGVSSINDFEWNRELRYYWEPYQQKKTLRIPEVVDQQDFSNSSVLESLTRSLR